MDSQITEKSVYQTVKPSAGLFDRIIQAIKTEQELRQSKKLLFLFTFLLIVSVATVPFSTIMLVKQWNESGTYYFMLITIENMDVFMSQWQYFVLSILESLPILQIIMFALNIALALFTLRLFIYKKGLMFKFLKYNFA